jgi:hypothetical protein
LFEIRDEEQLAAHLPAAALSWTIIIDTAPLEIKPSTYILTFEPYGGKLRGLHGSDVQ